MLDGLEEDMECLHLWDIFPLASVWQLLMKFKFHGRNVWPLYY